MVKMMVIASKVFQLFVYLYRINKVTCTQQTLTSYSSYQANILDPAYIYLLESAEIKQLIGT